MDKDAVRDYLRATGREAEWTELQGRVYGELIARTKPFPGVLDFLRICRQEEIPVCIISHKTRRPYAGPEYDLHQAALDWMTRWAFFEYEFLFLSAEEDVFLEETKAAKLARIGQVGCTHFLDDLPEFLSEPDFPAGVQRLLFDPQGRHTASPEFAVVHHWKELPQRLGIIP